VLVDRSLQVTSFFLIMGCLVAMGESLRRLSKLNNLLQRANAAATRIFEILDLPTERPRSLLPQGSHTTQLGPIRESIVFENVSFAYPGTSAPAVDGVSLEVSKGKVVAIVGRNGSGKTTLLALLPRFYDPSAGRILIDGTDIRTASLPSLRGQISVVTQESIIFPGTIAQNIAYGHPYAHLLTPDARSPLAKDLLARVVDAATKAFANDFITAKPLGYHTPLDGLGGQLSGGQKQRLCIARAILRHAPILILDEATSQVDAESEHLIQQAIDQLMRDAHGDGGSSGVTTFVIAHRFSTILSADEIIVMEQGRIHARGTHDQLLQQSEVYQQLYERQLMRPQA
jgi:subfamily B ATP-binding cassette protein MsbA